VLEAEVQAAEEINKTVIDTSEEQSETNKENEGGSHLDNNAKEENKEGVKSEL
jgi:hypothetical protein